VLRRNLCLYTCTLTAISFLLAPSCQSQPESSPAPVKTEIQIEGGTSVGNFHLFGYSDNRRLTPFGVEYDTHIWGGWLGSKVDYVGELLPVVLLDEPAKYDTSGHAIGTGRQIQYGAGISPIGVRMMWRNTGQFQPYLIGKGGVLYFENRVLSTEGTHMQFSSEFGGGIEKAVTSRIGYRLSYNDFHFSNGDIGRHNPGIDFMYINAALTIRFAKR
jgi:opacity protein-like surface antigen